MDKKKILIVIILILAAAAAYYFFVYKKDKTKKRGSSRSSSKSSKSLFGSEDDDNFDINDLPPLDDFELITKDDEKLDEEINELLGDTNKKISFEDYQAIANAKKENQQKIQQEQSVLDNSTSIDRTCGAGPENKAPCGKGYILTSLPDPKLSTDENPVLVNCCLIDPSRNDKTTVDSAVETAIFVAKAIAAQEGTGLAIKAALRLSGTSFKGLEAVVSKGFSKLASKLVSKTTSKATTTAQKQLAKLATSKLQKSFLRTTLRATGKALTKVATKAAAATTKLAAKAGMGPIGWGLMIFDIISIGVDLADPAGYDNIKYLEEYKKARDKAEEQFANELRKEGITPPIVIGPAAKLPDKTPPGLPEDPPDGNPRSKEELASMVTTEYLTEYIIDVMENIDLTMYSETEISEIQEKIAENGSAFFETKEGEDYISKRQCEIMKGLLLSDNSCSYTSREKCDASYDWSKIKADYESEDPNAKSSGEIFVEWRDNKCVVANPLSRITCEKDNFPYDYDKRLCVLTAEYCRGKGLDPIQTADGIDCKLSGGQEFAELLFGTTFTRSIIQTFDPAQYKPCNPGDYDGNNIPNEIKTAMYAIPTTAAAYGMLGNKLCVTPSRCEDGKVLENGLCYEKCRDGYTSDGALMCYKSTPPNWPGTSTITHLQHHDIYKPGGYLDSCNNDEVKDGALCYPNCRAGYHGVGPVCWADGPSSVLGNSACPNGWRSDGTHCWEDAVTTKDSCGPGETDTGTDCWGKCEVCADDCSKPWDGCKHRWWSAAKCNRWGKLTSWSLFDDHCKEWGGWECTGGCPTTCGQADCIKRNLASRNLQTHGCGCIKQTDPGSCPYPNYKYITGVCWPDSYGRGAGTELKCAPGREQRAAMCYDSCSVHNTGQVSYERRNDNIEFCSTVCPPGTTNIGIGGCQKDSYSRPAGTIPFRIYVKERLVPYSKK
jgi:hypothetical protein